MKQLRFTFIILALSALTLSLTNCSGGEKQENKTEKSADKSGPEYTSAYVCPMHCKGSGSNEPGICGVCGMDMKKNPDHQAAMNGDDHEGNGEGEDHSGHDHE